MLRADAVTFAYRSSPVIRDVSLTAAAGARVGLLGPNGAGKTTLLHLLAGLLTPASGTIRLDGAPLGSLSRRALARRLALVPQGTTLAFDYSVLEVALMGRYPHLDTFGVEGPDDLDAVMTALGATRTAHLAERPFSTLSGGERQRVIIAGAVAQLLPGAAPSPSGPRVLLLDEPTAALDLGSRLELAALVRDLERRTPVTLLVSTHDLDFVTDVCDQLILLRDGGIVAAGPTATVLTADHLGAVYDVDVEVVRHRSTGRTTVIPRAPVAGSPR